MKHLASPAFWTAYGALPRHIRDLADKNFELLKRQPDHPSLHLKRIGRYWSVRVGARYRALAVEAGDGLLWFWIGSHADYDKLLQRRSVESVGSGTPEEIVRVKASHTGHYLKEVLHWRPAGKGKLAAE